MTDADHAAYVAPPKVAKSDDLPLGEDRRMWSPTASTLNRHTCHRLHTRNPVTARAWHIATGDRHPATGTEQTAPSPLPPRPTPQHFYPGLDDWGCGRSIEWRFTRGSLDSLGSARCLGPGPSAVG